MINNIAKFNEIENNKIIKVRIANKQLLQQEISVSGNEIILSIKTPIKAKPIPLLLVDFFGWKLLKFSKIVVPKIGTLDTFSRTGTIIKKSLFRILSYKYYIKLTFTSVKIMNYIICAIIIDAIPKHSKTNTFNLNKITDIIVNIKFIKKYLPI
jgi:hypothetical protein